MLDSPIVGRTASDDSDDLIKKLAARLDLTLRVQSNPGVNIRARHSKSQPLVFDNVVSINKPSPSLLVNPARFRTTEGIDDYKHAVFLFADIIDSCKLGQKMTPREFVNLTDPAFTGFQQIVEKYGTPYGINVVKINGDCIMLAAASHVFEETQEQVDVMIYISQLFSKFMLSHNEHKKAHDLTLFDFRFGIDIGEATKTRVRIKDVNGVREQIDWSGNAANRASRMESTSHPNQVQVTDSVYEIAKRHFEFTTPSLRPIKGYDEMVSTRFLVQPKPAFLEKQKITPENHSLQKTSSSSTEFPRKALGNNRSSSANH